MDNTFTVWMKRLVCCTVSAGTALSLIQVPVLAAPPADLVNRAADFGITVPSYESGKGPKNLVDGDVSTLWVASSGEWPSTLTFTTPLDAPTIYKVAVKFEQGFDSRSVDFTLQHVVNNVTSQPIIDAKEDNFRFGDTFTYTWPEGMSCTELNLILSDPRNNGEAAGFWPGVAEVEIYTAKGDDEEEEELVNIAPSGTVSSSMPGQGNPGNLVDEDYSSLYVFSKDYSNGDDVWAQIDFESAKTISSIETAFENVGANDPAGFVFTYDLLGRADDESEWQTLAENCRATRKDGENIRLSRMEEPVSLKSVRVKIVSIENTGGNPWPALAEMKVFAPADTSVDIPEGENILSGKSIHTNSNPETVSRVIDGRLNSVWSGEMYPAYIDIDLGENYRLDDAVVYTPEEGYSQYSIYTSMDGSRFDRVARKTSEAICGKDGETWDLGQKEARVIRLYMEYNSNSSKSQVREFVVHGTPSNTEVLLTPEVVVSDFDDTLYAAPVTAADTIAEVQGIISRRLGEEYVDWFTFELKNAENGYDYYDVEAVDGKIHITGNNGVSLAMGLNAWMEEIANVHISQVGDQVKMPETILLPQTKMHKETKYPVRYSYNFCTLSYSMAFWGEKEWRNELDWLALNGVNVVLDATGMEEVWRRFLGACGYSHQEIKDFIAGPAYYAWFYMDNLSGMGGPVPDEWFTERTELARKNHRIMQVLGMQPVLQGYCGMVPVDFTKKQPEAKVIQQPKWCGFQRPYMLKTDDASTFNKYAAMFYQAQKDVFGDITNYYATDPFHEGGNTGGMNVTTIARETLNAMIEADQDAIWVIQAWQGNPTTELLNGLEGRREHALVLDLYAERDPHWNATWGYGNGEFGNTPWVYCMLNNFGGRLGLYGHLESLNKAIPAAANSANHMAGIGIAPEASQNNPLLYEFIFDTIWTDDADRELAVIDLDQWLADYARRRYGAESDAALEALKILGDTVYDGLAHEQASPSGIGQGAPENVVNSRPGLSIGAASTWGWSSIRYSKAELERALELLVEDWDLLKASPAYRYDVVSVAQQVLSNTAQSIRSQMNTAVASRNLSDFTYWSDLFLSLIETSDDLLSTESIYTLGNWTQAASRLVADPDDFTRDLFDLNAKVLVSTWGSIEQCNAGGLKDYSNRQWSGLTRDLYLNRWTCFINEKKKELAGEEVQTFSGNDWFAIEWAWARDNSTIYPSKPSDRDVRKLVDTILSTYSNRVIDPTVDNTGTLSTEGMSAIAGSESGSDPAGNVLDGDESSIWHTNWTGSNGTDRENCWIELQLDAPAVVTSLLYKPRPGAGNGTITRYRVEVKNTKGNDVWTPVAQGTWLASDSWKEASFALPYKADRVRLTAIESFNGEANQKNFASASEIRLKGTRAENENLNIEALQMSLHQSIRLDLTGFPKNEEYSDFRQALKSMEELFDPERVLSQKQVDEAVHSLSSSLMELRRRPDPDALDQIGR